MKNLLGGIVIALALAACGSDGGGPSGGSDAGTGGSLDAGTSMPVDAYVPPGTDAGTPPTGTDAGTPPTGTDAGTPPTGSDAGTSTGTRDPRLESDPDPGEVTCGSATCTVPGQTCCTSLSGQMCTAPGSCSGGFSAPGNCDGPEDCSGGQLCCAPSGLSDLTMGTTCAASCGSRFRMCQTDADCAGGQTCHTCRPPMGMGNVVGLCNTGDRCPGSYTTL